MINTRIWHFELLPYLPDAQFKGQLRELVAIARDWEEKGATNHLLINKVMEYQKEDLVTYFYRYCWLYKERYNKFPIQKNIDYFQKIAPYYQNKSKPLFVGWHNNTYLRICMYNLLEKHLGVGKSRVTDEEWDRLCDGYKKITGNDFVL